MPRTGLDGPFLRTEIDEHVPDKVDGAYALGRIDPDDGKFVVMYSGRSDRNKKDGIRGRLRQHDGEAKFKNCTHFKWKEFKTEGEAYDRECMIMHEFQCKLNQIHPPVPPGTQRVCPFPGCGHPNPKKKP